MSALVSHCMWSGLPFVFSGHVTALERPGFYPLLSDGR